MVRIARIVTILVILAILVVIVIIVIIVFVVVIIVIVLIVRIVSMVVIVRIRPPFYRLSWRLTGLQTDQLRLQWVFLSSWHSGRCDLKHSQNLQCWIFGGNSKGLGGGGRHVGVSMDALNTLAGVVGLMVLASDPEPHNVEGRMITNNEVPDFFHDHRIKILGPRTTSGSYSHHGLELLCRPKECFGCLRKQGAGGLDQNTPILVVGFCSVMCLRRKCPAPPSPPFPCVCVAVPFLHVISRRLTGRPKP